MIFERKINALRQYLLTSQHIRWGVLLLIAALFTVCLYPSLVVKKHSYAIGDVAKTDVKASENFFIEDQEATEANRLQAIEGVLSVYDLNPKILKNTIAHINEAFDTMRGVYDQESQKLRLDLPEPTAAVHLAETPTEPMESVKIPDLPEVPIEDRLMAQKSLFDRLLGIEISSGAYRVLIEHAFSKDIPKMLTAITTEILSTGVVANKEILLKELDKGITLRNVENLTETHILKLKPFFGIDQAKTMVRVIGDPLVKGMDYDLLNLVVDISQRLIQPNITFNSLETEARREAAAERIKPVLYMIKKGEMLLREGERVTALQLRKLSTMQGSGDIDHLPLAMGAGAALFMAILVIQYHVRFKKRTHDTITDNKDLFFVSCILVAFILVVKTATTLPETWFLGLSLSRPESSVGFGIPLAAGSMIVCLFLGREIALIVSLALCLSAAMLLQGNLAAFVYFILSCTMGAWWLKDSRDRKIIIKAAVKLAFLNVFLALIVDCYLGVAEWTILPFDLAGAFIGGIFAGIVTAGTAPVVEIVFGYTTNITLLELSNLDRPILRRLMLEAPGTYHHSVTVGSLVEAAASEIGANPILAKVCGYYHDIGKLKKPLYFVENQSNGHNRHDKLAPSMSALILIAHVKNGVEIAREHKLGQAIIDAIEQHHGTSLISYFYEKAKAIKGGDMVKIDDFRYPGPRPQTREAGLVMLADVVEAASRTLENPTPSRIQGLVQNLISKIFTDGQLDYCELTLKDLHLIAKSFNKILNGIHHHRIEYQDSSSLTSGKQKNGNSDRQPAKPPPLAKPRNTDDRKAHLKRLGLS